MIDNQLISFLSKSVDTLEYSARTRHLLERYQIKTVADLACLQEDDVLRIKGVGQKTMEEIRNVTRQYFRQIFEQYPKVDINKAIKLTRSIKDQPLHSVREIELAQFSIDDSVNLLPIPIRGKNSLLRGGIETVKDLIEASEDDIRQIKNIGEKTILEIRPIRNKLCSLLDTDVKSSPRGYFDLPYSIVTKLKNSGIDNIDNLAHYTSEDLILNVHLAYLELLQVQHYLSSIGFTLSTRWPTQPLISESSYQYLVRIGAPLEKINISRLALPEMLQAKLLRVGMGTVDSIACQSKIVLFSAIGFEANELINILEDNLKTYIEWLSTQNNWESETTNQGISPLYFIQLPETSLEEVIEDLLTTIHHERYRRLIRLRYGLDGGNRRTLQEIGDRLDISRERVRQLEKSALGNLAQGKKKGLIQAIYQSVGNEIRNFGGLMSLAQIGSHITDLMEIGEVHLSGAITLLLSLEPSQFVEIQPNKRWGLVDSPLDIINPTCKELINILNQYHAPLYYSDLEDHLYKTLWYLEFSDKELLSTMFIRACLSTDDRFEEILDDQWALTRWRKSRTSEIVLALRKLGKPSHFTEIARVANEMLPPEQQASPRLYHAQISNKPHLFAWVDRGTFGLVEWGLKRARFYVDIAEELLEQKGSPLTFGEIYPVINAEREASSDSIMFMLGTNPRFCSYPDGKYGLAIWLEDTNKKDEKESYDDPFLEDLKKRLFDS